MWDTEIIIVDYAVAAILTVVEEDIHGLKPSNEGCRSKGT